MANIKRTTVALVLGVMLLILAAVGILWTVLHYTIVDWRFYPKNQYVLDIRNEEVSPEHFEKLQEALPGSWIVWNVPFQGGSVSSDTTELTLTSLSAEDVPMLAYFPQLRTIHADNCTDYPQMYAAARLLPHCNVQYFVPIAGELIPSGTEFVTVNELSEEDARMLECLPKVARVDGSKSVEYSRLMDLAERHPEWDVLYELHIGSKRFSTEDTEIQATGAESRELEMALKMMPNVKTVYLRQPVADGKFLQQLRQDYPNVKINWELTFGDVTLKDDQTEVDVTGIKPKTLEEAEALADYFPQLEMLVFGEGMFENRDLSKLREAHRADYKVVWTIRLTKKCVVRTDDKMFMPIKQGEYYFQDKDTKGLEYAEEIEAMDIGHSRVRNLDFVKNMPHLKYLIVADSDVRDLTPLANHTELIWLELGWDAITSFEPLVSCTALEDLNVGRTNAYEPDPEPICRMTWLKNLWCMDMPQSYQWMWRQALPDTWIVGKGSDVVAYGWRRLPNYYKMRDALGMYYMD